MESKIIQVTQLGTSRKMKRMLSEGWRVVSTSPAPHGNINVALERAAPAPSRRPERTAVPSSRTQSATPCEHAHQTAHSAAGKEYTICLDCDQVVDVAFRSRL